MNVSNKKKDVNNINNIIFLWAVQIINKQYYPLIFICV